MSEKITAITPYEGVDPNGWREAGFQVQTTEQTITLAIDDQGSVLRRLGLLLVRG